MSITFKLRLTVLFLVAALLLSLMAWSGYEAIATMQEVRHVPDTFGKMQKEFLAIAQDLSTPVEELDRLLLQVAIKSDRNAVELFRSKSKQLESRLQERSEKFTHLRLITTKPVEFNASSGALFDEIGSTYREYQNRAASVVAAAAQQKGLDERLDRFGTAHRQYQKVLALGNQALAQEKAIDLFLKGYGDYLPWFARQRSIFVGYLIVLVGVCVWLAVTVYRLIVGPLRRTLFERETLIERQQKLAHLGELAAVLAHEIRNPLTAIDARLFTLNSGLSPGTEEATDARVIGEEIKRLDGIVTQFLDFARPGEPTLIPISADSLLREVEELMARSLKKRQIQLAVESTVETKFRADPRQLKQVLINLIRNGADSIQGEGTITLRARQDKNRIDGQEIDVVAIEVEDTGSGIPDDIRSNLFDPFFSTKNGGTGLGLPIAKRIVTQHGGDIEFDTKLDKGTTFRIVLPVYDAPPEGHAKNSDS